jgi:L-lactate dehydrogenase complex protein LldE
VSLRLAGKQGIAGAPPLRAQTSGIATCLESSRNAATSGRGAKLRAGYIASSRVRIALFIACYNDTLFPETGKAVVRVLERLGHTVDFPTEQTCCGQMHYNTGYQKEALPMMRSFLEVFAEAEAICVPSASCVAMMRDHYPKMAKEARDQNLSRLVNAVLPRVYEFSELLVDRLGVTDVGAFYPHTVTLHTSCHSLRSLQVGDKPAQLLRRVGGLNLVDLPASDQCCGFGGTFAVKNAEVSAAMLSDKVRCILDTQAEICTAGDNSCLMHIGGALSRQRTGVRCVHLAEILSSTESGSGDRK